jgi:hypothetical protein
MNRRCRRQNAQGPAKALNNIRGDPDPTDRLGSWARGFIRSAPTDTSALLADLNSEVPRRLAKPGPNGLNRGRQVAPDQ